jgi:DNA-binding transcriptional LysR family regulator
MNLEYLNTFIEVAKLGSLSQAAKKLYISQPTVTFQIKRLEQELGYRLIERDTHRVLLTINGKRFFQFAEYVYQEHKHLLFDMAQNEKGVTGRLSIAASPVIGEYVVPSLISRFKEDSPAVNMIVKIMDSQHVIKAVAENPEMVGFCGIAPKSSELNSVMLGEDEMLLIVYPGHPLTMKKQVTIDDLFGETLIFRVETVGGDYFYSRTLRKAGLDPDVYQPQIITGTTTGVLAAVESKAGIGFLSHLAIKHSEAMGMVKVVKIKNIRLKHQYYFVHNKSVAPGTLLESFIGFIKQLTLNSED